MWGVPWQIVAFTAACILAPGLLVLPFVGRRRRRRRTVGGMTPTERMMLRSDVLAADPYRRVSGTTQIRRLLPIDAPALASTLDEVVDRYEGWSEADRNAYVRALTGPTRRTDLLAFAIEAAAADGCAPIVVGAVVCVPDHDIQIGGVAAIRLSGWIGPDHRRHGHMRTAIGLVLASLSETDGDRVATAMVSALSTGARRALEQNGFQERGAVSHILPNGEEVVAVHYWRRPHADGGHDGTGTRPDSVNQG